MMNKIIQFFVWLWYRIFDNKRYPKKHIIQIDLTSKRGFIAKIKNEIISIELDYIPKEKFNLGDYLMLRLNGQVIAKASPSNIGIRKNLRRKLKLGLFNVPLESGDLTYTINTPFSDGKGSKLTIIITEHKHGSDKK